MNDFSEGLEGRNEVKTESQLSDKEQHEASYTEILKAYTKSIQKTLCWKFWFKVAMFFLSYALLIAVSVWLFFALKGSVASKEAVEAVFDWKEWLVSIGPVVVSFLTVFIVIPKVITEYLFNSEEEKYMSEIIKNIQDYDKKK